MAKPSVTNELWEVCEPVIPPLMKSPKGGRPQVGNREALTGILSVLKTGRAATGDGLCGFGMTC